MKGSAPSDGRPPRVLVFGHGRSGTTWLARALASTEGAIFVNEPDQPTIHPFACRANRALGAQPVVASDQRGPEQYRRIWDAAFGATTPRIVRGQGRLANELFKSTIQEERARACDPRSPRRSPRLWLAGMLAVPCHAPGDVTVRVVKSIRLFFALDWVRKNWNPVVVICRRHPLDVVASHLSLGLGRPTLDWLVPEARAMAQEWFGVPEPEDATALTAAAWSAGMLMSVLELYVRRWPDVQVVDHEVLCAAPVVRLRELASGIGLAWGTQSNEFVDVHERDGSRYEINRIASEQSGKWRSRLSADDARTAARVIAQFPIAERYDLS